MPAYQNVSMKPVSRGRSGDRSLIGFSTLNLFSVLIPVWMSALILGCLATSAMGQVPPLQSSPLQSARTASSSNNLASVRVPGEFEPQQAIVLSITDWMPHHYPILQQIVGKAAKHVNVLILYDKQEKLREVVTLLAADNLNDKHVFFSRLQMNTIWLRDFCPRLAELAHGWISIDFLYEGSRPLDETFPRRWASVTKTRLRTVRWTVQGGNLICNGAGVAIATDRIFSDNNVQFPNPRPGTNPVQEAHDFVTSEFKRSFNLDQLVILEPLQQEATRHVDMFATFLAADQVVVARVDPISDAINAAILDRNVRRLRSVIFQGRPLQVHRIDVPPREQTFWSPYTNIILANRLLLMPTFDSDPQPIVQKAIATYQQLLPGYEIQTIDMTSMKTLQGSLHCLSMNLPKKSPWPMNYFSLGSAVKQFDL